MNNFTISGFVGLNPCCSGQWSSTKLHHKAMAAALIGLNPCCSGQWSSTRSSCSALINLVCLNPCCSGQWSSTDPDGKKVCMTMAES